MEPEQADLTRANPLFATADPRFPTICDYVYASVVVSGEGEIAVLYWARSVTFGLPLVLLDYDVVTFAEMTWSVASDKLGRFEHECGARYGSMGLWVENASLAGHIEAAGIAAMPIAKELTGPAYWEALNLSAGFHVGAERVKVTRAVMVKSIAASDGTGDALNRRVLAPLAPNYRLGPRDDDPTIAAWLYGIMLGLDPTAGQLLQKPAKKSPQR